MATHALSLIGLLSIVRDYKCSRIDLRGGPGEPVKSYVRRDLDTWVGPEEDLVDPEAVVSAIQAAFGSSITAAACHLGTEVVEYVLVGGDVRVKRRAVSPSSDPGTAEREFARVAEALGIPKSKRKAKLRQASRFAALVEEAVAKLEQSNNLRILDLACGRSYLGMELIRFLARDGRTVSLHGVDGDPELVAKCRDITKALGWAGAAFDTADLRSYSIEPDQYDVVVSLHACDTLSDEAIRIACEGRVPLAFLAPCCQHELRHQWKDHPLEWIARYGILEQRLADVLTDGLRCLVMDAMGYQVNVLRFVEPEVTPKNILLQGRLVSEPRPARVKEARAFMELFHVRPRLAEFLDRAKLP